MKDNWNIKFHNLTLTFLGSIPRSIGNLRNLKELSLWGNLLSGTSEIPHPLLSVTVSVCMVLIYYLHGAHSYFLHACIILGPIPDTITEAVSLEKLHLCENQLSGLFLEHVMMFISNELIVDVIGCIPTNIGCLKNLKVLWLFCNCLSGLVLHMPM